MEKQTVKAREAAKKRKPLSTQNRLEVVGELPGFHTRIVKDVPGRISRFEAAGWEPVTKDELQVGTARTSVAQDTSENVNYIDLGGGDKGLLMKIPNEYWEEDQKVKEDRLKAQEDALKHPALEGRFGTISIT